MQSSRSLFPRLFAVLAFSCLISLMLIGCSRSIADRPLVNAGNVQNIRNGFSDGSGGGGGAEVEEQDPTGWVTVSGNFKFAAADIGKIPAPTALEVGGTDAAACRAGGTPMSKTVLVDKASGGLKNVVIFLADDLSKKKNTEKWIAPGATGATEPVVFDQNNCQFLTHVVGLQVTQPLEILNSDSVGHNTALSATPFNRIIPTGGKEVYQHRAETRLPYAAKCSIHPWMTAYIFPRNNGYFAVSGEDGSFKIENLPAGVDLTLKIWHEKVGLLKTVKINGEQTSIPKRGLVAKWEPGEVKFDVELDAQPFTQ